MINYDFLEQSQDAGERQCEDSQPTQASRSRSRRNITKKLTRADKGVREKCKYTLFHVLLHDR